MKFTLIWLGLVGGFIALAIWVMSLMASGVPTAEPEQPCIDVIQAASLHTQGSFIHFEGIVVSDSRPWSKVGVDDYRFPEEVREGYLTLIEEYVGHSTYLLWTENKAFEYPGQELKFWAFTDNIALIEETTILFPMINTIEK